MIGREERWKGGKNKEQEKRQLYGNEDCEAPTLFPFLSPTFIKERAAKKKKKKSTHGENILNL